jgi:uncharacterized membrane protein YgaE (UPF0421/DUF939 family)
MSQSSSQPNQQNRSKRAAIIFFIASLITYLIGANFYAFSSFTLVVIAVNVVFFVTRLATNQLTKKEQNHDAY